MLELAEAALLIFDQEPSVRDISLQSTETVTIVGDLHGQLPDLLSIFKLNGIPGPGKHYLFNGDFVDRGTDSMGVLCSLLALKCYLPECVFLNRGNHESPKQNKVFGFEEEVLAK